MTGLVDDAFAAESLGDCPYAPGSPLWRQWQRQYIARQTITDGDTARLEARARAAAAGLTLHDPGETYVAPTSDDPLDYYRNGDSPPPDPEPATIPDPVEYTLGGWRFTVPAQLAADSPSSWPVPVAVRFIGHQSAWADAVAPLVASAVWDAAIAEDDPA